MSRSDLTIFQSLRRDHRNTRQLLDALQSEIDRISGGGKVDYKLLFMIMDYLINYPDLYHHAEETALFVFIRKHNELLNHSIDRILNEHKDAGMLSRRIAAALHNMQHGNEVPIPHLQKMIHEYVERQKDHMTREDTVYFPILERALEAGEWREVSEELARIEDPLFGENVRRNYLARHENIMRLMMS